MYHRKIHFFQIIPDSRNTVNLSFDEALKSIAESIPSNKKLSHSSGDEGDELKLVNIQDSNDYRRCSLARYRSDHLTTGNIDDDEIYDQIIGGGRRVTELTHFLYMPDSRILAIEYNSSGAREGALLWYTNTLLHAQYAGICRFKALPIFHPDTQVKLQKAKSVKFFEFQIPRQRIIENKDKNNLLNGLYQATSLYSPGRISMRLDGASKDYDRTVLVSPEKLLNDINTGEIDLGIFDKASVSVAYDVGSEIVNLLENRIKSDAVMADPVSTENAEIWFNAIFKVYQDNRDILHKATSHDS